MKRILLSLGLVLAGATVHAGQFTNKGTLYGTLLAVSKKPLVGVTIVLTRPGTDDEGTMFTNGTGYFSAYPLEPGRYIVRAYYSNVRVECREITVVVDDSIGLAITMPDSQTMPSKYTQDCALPN